MNYIWEYYSRIKTGQEIVGNWIHTLYLTVVKNLEDKVYYYSERDANRCIKFIETMCHHSVGRNDLIVLELWQKALLSLIFAIVDEHGIRYFREIMIVLARKQGKSLLAACISAYEAYLGGEYGTEIYFIAPKLEQADIVYDAFNQIVQSEPELNALQRSTRKGIYIAESNTWIKKIAFNYKKADGFNPQLTVCDEIHAWIGDGGLKQYEVMTSAIGARKQPLILSISTAGYQNNGIYDDLMSRSTAVLKGTSKERRLLPVLYIIDDPDKWNDINELRKSMPNLGVSVSVDYIIEQIAIADQSLSKRAEFLTKFCNIKQNSATAFLDAVDLEKAMERKYELDDFRDCYCVGGIDLSQTTDLTAASVVIERDGELYTFCQFFMPENRIEIGTVEDGVPYEVFRQRGLITASGTSHVDYKDVYNWFVNLQEAYNIRPVWIGYDRWSARYLIDDLMAYGFQCDDVRQGDNLTPVLYEFEGWLKDRKLHLGDNPLLMAHMFDVAVKENIDTRRIRPVKINERSRIDGFVSVIDAMTVRQKWYGENEWLLKNERTEDD